MISAFSFNNSTYILPSVTVKIDLERVSLILKTKKHIITIKNKTGKYLFCICLFFLKYFIILMMKRTEYQFE